MITTRKWITCHGCDKEEDMSPLSTSSDMPPGWILVHRHLYEPGDHMRVHFCTLACLGAYVNEINLDLSYLLHPAAA